MDCIEYINHIIKESTKRKLSGEEIRDLASWIEQCDENREIYIKLKAAHSLENSKEVPMVDLDRKNTILKKIKNRKKLVHRSRYIAASLLFLTLSVGGYFFMKEQQVPENNPIEQNAILAAESQGITILKNRQRIDAEMISSATIKNRDKEEFNLQQLGDDQELLVSVKRGYQYTLILPDSSRVWMNSESQLRYRKFDEKKRVVELTGEACFDVKKDTRRPFVVVLKNGININVLGTFFSVKAYSSDSETTVGLIRGSVTVVSEKDTTLLCPAKEYVRNNSNHQVSILDLDEQKRIAWINGNFTYNNDRLENVVKDLSRRFDKEFVINDENLASKRITMILGNASLSEILTYMNRSGKGLFQVKMSEGKIMIAPSISLE